MEENFQSIPNNSGNKSRLVKILISVLVLAGIIGFGVFWLFTHSSKTVEAAVISVSKTGDITVQDRSLTPSIIHTTPATKYVETVWNQQSKQNQTQTGSLDDLKRFPLTSITAKVGFNFAIEIDYSLESTTYSMSGTVLSITGNNILINTVIPIPGGVGHTQRILQTYPTTVYNRISKTGVKTKITLGYIQPNMTIVGYSLSNPLYLFQVPTARVDVH